MPRLLIVLLACASPGLVACGGDDEKEAEQTVREFVTATNERDSEKFCDELVTQEFAERATGAKGDKARSACRDQLKSLKGLKLRLERISSAKVDGDKAEVKAVLSTQGQRQDQLFRLEKEDGDWRLAGGG